MKKYFLMMLSCLVLLNNAYAKAIEVFNPCTQEQVALAQILSNKNILLDKTVSLNDAEMFLISYLDQSGEICMQKNMMSCSRKMVSIFILQNYFMS